MSIKFAQRIGAVGPSAIRDLLKHGADPRVISFGGGYPDPALFPIKELRTVYERVITRENSAFLQYSPTEGLPHLREHIAARMRRDGTDCDADDVLMVNGSQQGIDLVAKLFLDAGDVVITESPTFLGALAAFNAYEATYAPVTMDPDGMNMDDLERVLSLHPKSKLIYTVPDFQNPTGVTMSLAKRKRLIELANRFDVIVIEDAPYRELRYESDAIPTLSSLDTEGRVVHLGSFSKILAPGLRLGWVVADGRLISQLCLLKLASDTQCSTVNMAVVATYLDEFDVDQHISLLTSSYRTKRDAMLRTLSEELPASVGFTRPFGGLFTWLTFPGAFDSAHFMREHALPEARVAFVPGAPFYPGEVEHNHARLSYSGVSVQRIELGVQRLGRLLNRATAGTEA